ncbi:MAG: hypothetical protein R6V75_06835, partial [Bacteroidales bacterium]
MKRKRTILLLIFLPLLWGTQTAAQDYQEQMRLIRPRPENVLVYGVISLPDKAIVTGATVSLIDPFSHLVVENISSDQKGWYLFSVKKGRPHALLIEVPGLFPYYSEFTVPVDFEEPSVERPVNLPATLTRIYTLVFNPVNNEPEPKSQSLLQELGAFLVSDPELMVRIIPEEADPDSRRAGHITEKLISMGIRPSRILSSPTARQMDTTVEIRISTNPGDLTLVSLGARGEPSEDSWTIQFTASRIR